MKLSEIIGNIEESVDKDEKEYARFYRENPEYKSLEKAIKLEDSVSGREDGAPVSKKRKSNVHLGMDEAYMLIKKRYAEKLTNSDWADVSYYITVTDFGRRVYGKMRQELMSIGYDD